MNFKTLEKKIIENLNDYSKKYNIKIDQEFASVKLFEEVGEFAQALLIHQKRCCSDKIVSELVSKQALAEEIADVIGMAIVNANLLGVDIEKAISQKWINRNK